MDLVAELRAQAANTLDPAVLAYLDYRAAGNAPNDHGWDRYALIPHILRGVDCADTRTSVCGQPLATPILTAPAGRATRYHQDGEHAILQATAENGTIALLPSSVAPSMPALAPMVEGARWWQQLYMSGDRGWLAEIIAQSAAAGCSAFVLTVDLLPSGGISLPPLSPAAWETAPARPGPPMRAATLADLEWLIATAGDIPVLVKGILDPVDVAPCIEAGARALIVSHHAGNQVAGVVHPAEMLGRIVAAAPDIDILVDGDIRSASDIARALALGARAVLLGRPTAYALAAGGAPALTALIRSMTQDLARLLALLGLDDVSGLTPERILDRAAQR